MRCVIKTVWAVLAHTKLLCRTGLPKLVFVFLFRGWEPSKAIAVLWAFGSLSTSKTWAPYSQSWIGFALAGWSVLSNDHCFVHLLWEAPPMGSHTCGTHSLRHSVSLRRWGGGLLFYKMNKKSKMFWFLKVWKARCNIISWELCVFVILHFFFFVLSKLLLFT